VEDLHITKRYLKLGREPWAYQIHSWFPQCVWFTKPFFFRQIYDCFGLPMHPFGRFRCTWIANGVQKSARIRGHGAPSDTGFRGLNVIVDLRTIEMIAEECCPPELLMEFLGTEGIPD